MARIAIVGTHLEWLTNVRGDLIRELVKSGHQVIAMAAKASSELVREIESLGVRFQAYPVQRNGLSPWRDVQTLFALRHAFHVLQPDVVLAYSIKPVIWGGLALRGVRSVKFYALIAGLGFAFQGERFGRKWLMKLVTLLYRVALRRASAVIFQNPDNRDIFISHNIVAAYKCHLVRGGSGVDTVRFSVSPLQDSGTVFLSIARLLGEKGLREYAEAAQLVKRQYPKAIFRLVGPSDSSPDAIPLTEVQRWHDRGWVEYLGATRDVRPFIHHCHVFVLASYHEGMPRAVLEAMAMGRPILTTDVPGCRETVVPGENGYLVPKANALVLAALMVSLIENRHEWARMGQASRRMAEQRFDVHKINNELMHIMELRAQWTPDTRSDASFGQPNR